MPFLSVNGTELHVHTNGEGEGPAIVFVHPPFIGSHIFTYLFNDLSWDHRTVLVDLRGHGHSRSGDAPLTMALIAEDIRQLLDRLEIGQAYLCGYSVGSMPVLEALLTSPERYKGAIMLSGCSELSDPVYRLRMMAASLALRMRWTDAVTLPIAWGNADNRLAFENLREEANGGEPLRWREYIYQCLSHSYTARLPYIRQDVLLLCGGANRPFLRYAQMMNGQLPSSDLYAVRGASHQLPTKEPAKVAETMRGWIARRETREKADTFEERSAWDGKLAELGLISARELEFTT